MRQHVNRQPLQFLSSCLQLQEASDCPTFCVRVAGDSKAAVLLVMRRALMVAACGSINVSYALYTSITASEAKTSTAR